MDPADISTTSAFVRWEKPDEPNGDIIRYTIRYEAVSMATGSGMQQGRRRRQAGNAIVPECILDGPGNIDRTETVDGTQTSITLQDLSMFNELCTFRQACGRETVWVIMVTLFFCTLCPCSSIPDL